MVQKYHSISRILYVVPLQNKGDHIDQVVKQRCHCWRYSTEIWFTVHFYSSLLLCKANFCYE